MATVCSIYHIEMVRLNPFQLVIVGTILEASCFLFEIPTGILADNYSRKLSLSLGLIIMGAGIFIEGYFPVFVVIAVAQVIWGTGATFLSGADIAWISDELEEKNIDQILLRGAQVRQIVLFAGIFVSIGAACITYNLPIIFSGIILCVLGCCVLFIMPEKRFQAQSTESHNVIRKTLSTFLQGAAQIRGNKVLIFLITVTLLGGLFSEGYDRLWTYRFLRDLALPDLGAINPIFWFAIIKACAIALNLAILEYVKRKVIHKESTLILRTLFVIYTILNSSILIFAVTGSFPMALASFWISFAMRQANEPLNDVIFNKHISNSKVRATVFSMRGQLDQVGQISGGPLIGVIAQHYSVSTGLLFSCVFITPIIFIYLFLLKHQN